MKKTKVVKMKKRRENTESIYPCLSIYCICLEKTTEDGGVDGANIVV